MARTFKANQRYAAKPVRGRITAAEARELARIENLVPGLLSHDSKLYIIKEGK